MKPVKPFHIYLALLAVIVVLGILIANPNWWVDPPKQDPHTIYETDTLYIPHSFGESEWARVQEMIEEGLKTKPSTITYYQPEYIDRVEEIEVIPDSLLILIDDLEDSLEVAWDFLATFPKQPKLLTLDLLKDSLSLGLLRIDGQTSKETYPIFLDRFTYSYDGSTFARTPVKSQKPVFNGDDIRLEAGYDWLGRRPYAAARYELEFRRLRFGASSILTVEQQPQLLLLTGVGLKLDK